MVSGVLSNWCGYRPRGLQQRTSVTDRVVLCDRFWLANCLQTRQQYWISRTKYVMGIIFPISMTLINIPVELYLHSHFVIRYHCHEMPVDPMRNHLFPFPCISHVELYSKHAHTFCWEGVTSAALIVLPDTQYSCTSTHYWIVTGWLISIFRGKPE